MSFDDLDKAWYGARREPHRQADGRFLGIREPRETRHQRDSRHPERRQRSLNRGYHSENELRHHNPRRHDPLDHIVVDSGHGGRRAVERGGNERDHHVAYRPRTSHLRPDDRASGEEDWHTEREDRPSKLRERGEHGLYLKQLLPRLNSIRPGNLPPTHVPHKRRHALPVSRHKKSDRRKHSSKHTETIPINDFTVPSRRHKVSRSRVRGEHAAFLSGSRMRSGPRERGEHAGYHHGPRERGEHVAHLHEYAYVESRTRPAEVTEHVSQYIGTTTVPRITRRAPTWRKEERDQRHSSSTSEYSLSDDSDVAESDHDGRAPIQRSKASSTEPRTNNFSSADPNVLKEQLDRIPVVHTLFEPSTVRRSSVTQSDAGVESRRSRPEQQAWERPTSRDSSAHLSQRTGSVSPGPGILGSKTFAYKELDSGMSFRLVKVLPERTSKLKCEILHASLEKPPPYVAISYVWGDGVDKRELVLEGVAIPVAASLHGALKAVRERETVVLVWVDQLSIDQQNQKERAEQVQLMGYIYSRAKAVAIWLGPDAEDSELALPLLKDIDRGTVSKERIKAVENQDSAALRALFQRDYWSRLWVVQEVFLAREKWVYCGSSKLPWAAYEAASNAFWEHESDPHLRKGPSSFPKMNTIVGRGADSLLEVLRASRKKLSENPRDKIFGVLGMLSEETRSEVLVDYNKPVKALYIEVADYIVSSTRRLDVIRESIHFPLHVSSARLPSWCPDWSHVPEMSALRERSFSAGGKIGAVFQFHDNERKLEITAVELGTVEMTGVAVGTFCALQDYLMAFLHWRAVLLSTFNIDEEQDTNHPALEAFSRTLSLGQIASDIDPKTWSSVCFHVFSSLINKRLPRLPMDRGLQRYVKTEALRSDERRTFLQEHFGDRMMGRTLCITNNNLIGMGSGYMRTDDIVVVPYGCSTPIILRAQGRGNEYCYVGDVYVHGFMQGEALTGNRPIRKYMMH